MANFLWGANGEEVTPEEIATRKQMAQSLLTQANQTPANYWTQGVSNMVNALMGGFMQGRAMRAERANDDYNKALVSALNGDGAFGGEGTDVKHPQTNASLGSDDVMRIQGGDQSDPFGGSGTDVNHLLVQALIPQGGAPASTASVSPVATALVSPSTPVGEVAQQGALDAITQDVMNHLKNAESGGRIDAKNPNSSASGPYQIINSTADGIRKNHPELGLTPGWQNDPNQVEIGAKAGAQDNLAALLAKGIHPTEGQFYQSWFTNPRQTAQIAQADQNAPISSILTPAQIRANPFLSNMTVGDFGNWSTNKMGGTGPSAMAPQKPQFPAQNPMQSPDQVAPQIQQGPSMDALVGVLSDPRANSQTKGVASALLNNQLQLQQVQQRYQMEQADPENVARRRYYDMETQALQQRMNQPQKQGSEYNLLSPQQAQQMGLDPAKSYQMDGTGKIMQIGNSGVNVTLNNGPTTSEFQKKSDDEAATRIGNYIAEGAQAPALIGQLQQLSDLSRNIGTGKGAQFMAAVGPYAQALGVNVKGLSDQQAFTAIVDRMAPQMRPVGSGSSSDTDVRMFMNSLPQLGNTDRGNQIIAGTMQALQQNKLQAADIASQAQRGQISWQDAESQIRKLPNPYEQFKKAHADLVSSAPSPASPTPQVGSQKPQYRVGQRAAWPDGSIRKFNGTTWVKEG